MREKAVNCLAAPSHQLVARTRLPVGTSFTISAYPPPYLAVLPFTAVFLSTLTSILVSVGLRVALVASNFRCGVALSDVRYQRRDRRDDVADFAVIGLRPFRARELGRFRVSAVYV